jgi:heme exporter protein A
MSAARRPAGSASAAPAAEPEPADSAAAVAVDSVGCRLGRRLVLAGVSLAVAPGEAVAVLGPNGAGKTTLLRVMAGLLRPGVGRVTLWGRDPGACAPAVRGRLGYLGHQTFLYDQLTALENLVYYGRLHGLQRPEARARELLEDEGLALFAHDPVRSFSRGMQQRLALCRAWLADPDLLLLDEPWTGLDPEAAARLEARVERLRGRGGSAVFTSHDLEAAVRTADRYAVLVAGRVVDAGACEPLRHAGRPALEAHYRARVAASRLAVRAGRP